MKQPLLRLLLVAVLVLAVHMLVPLSVSSNAVPQAPGALELERAKCASAWDRRISSSPAGNS